MSLFAVTTTLLSSLELLYFQLLLRERLILQIVLVSLILFQNVDSLTFHRMKQIIQPRSISTSERLWQCRFYDNDDDNDNVVSRWKIVHNHRRNNHESISHSFSLGSSLSSSSSSLSSSSFVDYEYIPNFENGDDDDKYNDNNDESSYNYQFTKHQQEQRYRSVWKTTSIYPTNTPATLRGEAVRSAIRSGRCIGWVPTSTSSKYSTTTTTTTTTTNNPSSLYINDAILSMTGKGTIPFLNSKFTRTFGLVDDNNSSSSNRYFQSACFLNTKGQLMDVIGVAVSKSTLAYLCTSTDKTNPNAPTSSLPLPIQVLYKKLNQYIFPLDEVQLTYTDCFTFNLVSISVQDIQNVIDTFIVPNLPITKATTNTQQLASIIKLAGTNPNQLIEVDFTLPVHDINNNTNDKQKQSNKLLIVPFTELGLVPGTGSGPGYKFIFLGNEEALSIGYTIWNQYMLRSDIGPIQIGPAEVESLRIELGIPGYGYEMIAGIRSMVTEENKKKINKETNLQLIMTKQQDDVQDVVTTSITSGTVVTTERSSSSLLSPLTLSFTPPSPFEVHLDTTNNIIDTTKGCYLGQEGIASIIKNPRGPPRTLYQVLFDDEFNEYNTDSEDEYYNTNYNSYNPSTTRNNNDNDDDSKRKNNVRKNNDNPTRMPIIGDDLYVLGSNESIKVGTITSIAEPGSTGDPIMFGLAMIRRPDSILKQMKDMNLQISSSSTTTALSSSNIEGIIPPPPLVGTRDQHASIVLDGLEVIVGSTYTVGRLQSVPSRGYYYEQRQQQGISTFSAKDRELVDLSFEYSIFADSVPQFVQNLASYDNDGPKSSSSFYRDGIAIDTVSSQVDNVSTGSSVENSASATTTGTSSVLSDYDEMILMERNAKELAKAEQEALEAAAEAQRKQEKMEALKRQAEQALLRRKQKQQQASSDSSSSS